MNHELAAKDLLAERYILGEMNANERADFEEHFFDCAECAASVRDGAAFLDSGRSLVRAERRFQRGRLMTWIPSAVAAALAVVVGIQSFAPHLATEAPAIQVLQPIEVDQSRGAAVQHARAGKPALLYINIVSEQPFGGYRFELRDASGHVRGTQPVTAQQATQTVPVLLGPLPAGSYQLVVEGVREDGNRTPIATYPVNVQGP